MLTQNDNECFNAQIWRRCPKTEATSLRTVETAVAMATLEFNQWPLGFQKVLEKSEKSEKVRLLDMREAREGITYQPAAFNS